MCKHMDRNGYCTSQAGYPLSVGVVIAVAIGLEKFMNAAKSSSGGFEQVHS